MSGIAFHTPEREVSLRGTERAYAGVLVDQLTTGWLIGFRFEERYKPLIPTGHYLHTTPFKPGGFKQAFKTWWRTGGGVLEIPDAEIHTFDVSLNTAIIAGSDPIELLARIHGTCEIHGWIDGPDREFIADIITEGLETNILRSGMGIGVRCGWEDVAALLVEDAESPCVMSYSVCESFPDPWALGIVGDDDGGYETWMAMDDAAQWDAGMKWLRTRPGALQITEDSWGSQLFGAGWSVFNLERWLNDNRPETS